MLLQSPLWLYQPAVFGLEAMQIHVWLSRQATSRNHISAGRQVICFWSCFSLKWNVFNTKELLKYFCKNTLNFVGFNLYLNVSFCFPTIFKLSEYLKVLMILTHWIIHIIITRVHQGERHWTIAFSYRGSVGSKLDICCEIDLRERIKSLRFLRCTSRQREIHLNCSTVTNRYHIDWYSLPIFLINFINILAKTIKNKEPSHGNISKIVCLIWSEF